MFDDVAALIDAPEDLNRAIYGMIEATGGLRRLEGQATTANGWKFEVIEYLEAYPREEGRLRGMIMIDHLETKETPTLEALHAVKRTMDEIDAKRREVERQEDQVRRSAPRRSEQPPPPRESAEAAAARLAREERAKTFIRPGPEEEAAWERVRHEKLKAEADKLLEEERAKKTLAEEQAETQRRENAAAAKLRIAHQYYTKGETAKCKQWLQQILDDYGDTPTAVEASEAWNASKLWKPADGLLAICRRSRCGANCVVSCVTMPILILSSLCRQTFARRVRIVDILIRRLGAGLIRFRPCQNVPPREDDQVAASGERNGPRLHPVIENPAAGDSHCSAISSRA